MPLSVSEKRFKHFMINFVISLPSFINIHREVCINVMIIINCFLKYTTFVFMQKINAVSINHIWLIKFYQKNGASNFIVLNCDSQFINNF